MRSCTVLFGELRIFLTVVLGFRNKIYSLNSVINGYVRSYTVGLSYVRLYTIIKGACPVSTTHLITNGPSISPSVRAGIYGVFF